MSQNCALILQLTLMSKPMHSYQLHSVSLILSVLLSTNQKDENLKEYCKI